jgi:uncharacterized protein
MNIKRIVLCAATVFLFASGSRAQSPDIKLIADTLVVQADGVYEADPDVATLTFDISSQDKDLKPTYDKAASAMQKIVDLAQQNGLRKEDISSGVLTVQPFYSGDRKKSTRSFLVQGQITLKVHDFSKLGTIMDGSITEGITDFRSLTYSLDDEEAAKQHAAAEAMRRAIGRANAALEQKGQKVGALGFANLDVKQLVQVQDLPLNDRNVMSLEQLSPVAARATESSQYSPPQPLPGPQKIKVTATVQCAFQIQ